ncbi:GNAT family N-acetyltransferase [Hymenobacter siberiensis]|uniref:GNAT family N-acetyltransferase n=1 Tax=Hymenobacter siberiensis TaxID=2848396 RepID=UPI001C1E878D|nr:GNAT family protein [Hymenobacter siberiensis]MBU6122878.1 GNAT family N-acetyltransferase [Hymenobacter siberiensis]
MTNIHLRELTRDDLPKLNEWRNDPEIIQFLGANFHFIGPAVDAQWFDAYLVNRSTAVRLAIVVSELNLFVGLINLTAIHAINRSAEFSIMLGNKDFWSKGVGQKATNLMLRHGFNDLNLHRIHLTVLSANIRAIKLYKNLGFREEGTQIDAIFKEGAFCNLINMALLKNEFNVNR